MKAKAKANLRVGVSGDSTDRRTICWLAQPLEEARRSGTTAHPIHEDIKGKPVPEERFVVTIRVDRIGNLAEHVLDQLLGITRPPQNLFRFGVGIQSPLHGMDIPRHAASHTRLRSPRAAR